MKRIYTCLISVILSVIFLPCAGFAADGSLANFKSDGEAPVFSDVLPDDWFAPYVRVVSKAGLMIGVGEDRFSPEADITLAEVYTIAARIEEYTPEDYHPENSGIYIHAGDDRISVEPEDAADFGWSPFTVSDALVLVNTGTLNYWHKIITTELDRVEEGTRVRMENQGK